MFNKRKKQKKVVGIEKNLQGLQQAHTHETALAQSIVLIGPQDVGKSVLAKNFARKYGLLYVNMQEVRHCDIDIQKIKRNVSLYNLYSKQSKFQDRSSAAKRYAQYAGIERHNLAFREAFPNVPNYELLGANNDKLFEMLKYIPTFAKDDICTHVYKQQYDDLIFDRITQSINTPCVIDMTTSGPIRLTKEYNKRIPVLLAEYDRTKYNECQPLTNYLQRCQMDINDVLAAHEKADAQFIHNIKSYGNVIALEYPQNKTPKLDTINSHYLNSGQYEKLAHNNVITADFISTDSNGCSVLDKQKLTECMDIMASIVYDNNPDIFKAKKEIELAF